MLRISLIPGETLSQRELGAGMQSRMKIICLEMGKGKEQVVLLLTIPSCSARQGSASPKRTPQSNLPCDGGTHCSSPAQLAGSGPPLAEVQRAWQEKTRELVGLRGCAGKACVLLPRSWHLLQDKLGWETRDTGYCLVASVPRFPLHGLGTVEPKA